MESVAIVLLLAVLGGGALLLGLIIAIVTGSSRSERLGRLEREQTDLRMGLHEAHRRIAYLEQELRRAQSRIEAVRQGQAALPPMPARAEVGSEADPQMPARAEVGSEADPQMPPRAEVGSEVHPQMPARAELGSEVHPQMPARAEVGSEADPQMPARAEVGSEADPQMPPRAEIAAPGPVIPVWPTPASPAAPAPTPPATPVATAAQVRGTEEPRQAQEAPEEPATPPPPPARFDWERWVGVRGAAALGACVLVIAGLYFFKYSIESGLLSPPLRVLLGTLVGLGGVIASEVTLRRKYTVLANWLGGAGVAILYTSFWAAHALYHLVGSLPSFGLMGLVTVTCGLLAMRHDTMVVALLGLAGGFATPFALSTGEDHPFGLFGYLLLLDSALLYLSVKRRWPVLGALSLLGTFFYQAAWIGARMGPERMVLGMGIVVVFAALYGLSLPEPSDDEGATWPLTRAATVLLPFGFGLYFGFRSDLGESFVPLGVMMLVLSGGAAWMSRARSTGWVATAAACAAMAVSGAWMIGHDRAAAAWEVVGLVAAIGAVFHAFRELDHARPSAAGPVASTRAAGLAALAGLFLLVVAAITATSADPWPWLSGWVALGAMAVRQSFLGAPALRLGVAALIGLGLPLVHAVHAGDAGFPEAQVFLSGIGVVTALALVAAARIRSDAKVVAGSPPSSKKRAPERGAGADGMVVLLAFLPAIYFAARADVAPHPAPIAAMLATLGAAAAWAARGAPKAGWLALASAIATLIALGTWLGVHDAPAVAWESAALVVVAGAAFHALAEPAIAARAGSGSLAGGAAVASLGGMALLLATASGGGAHDPWPFVAGALLLAAFVLRQARAEGRAPLAMGAAVVLGIGLPFVYDAHRVDADFPAASVWLGLAIAIATGASALAHVAPEGPRRRWASHAAALVALLLLGNAFESAAPPPLVFGVSAALIALALVSAARLGHGGWAMAAAGAGALVELSYVLAFEGPPAAERSMTIAIAGQLLAVALIAAWPVIAAGRFQTDAWAWRAGALAGPLFFPGLYQAWTSGLGKGAIGLLPLALGAIAAGVATRARPALPAEGPLRKTALVWLFAVTLCSISVAVPLQLDNEWVTVAWALEGAALLALWKRMDHAGLKYVALAHLAVISIRLVMNPAVLDYHARGGLPVLNWLLYTYWIPTAALAAAWWLLHALEAPRARSWEAGLYPKGKAIFAGAAAASAIVVFFVWENLTIFDAFGEGTELHVAFDRMPARDLTLSIAWAAYALVLLGLGMARRSAALRWTSLALIIVTVGKAFLYDLSHLHDLYRVMSLVGLAFSLILISLAYQRFVFKKRDDEEAP